MSSQPDDTHPDAKKVQLDLLRRASVSERLRLTLSLSQTVTDLAKRALRRRYPHEGEQEILLRFVSVHYGAELAGRLSSELRRRSN